MDPTSHNYYKKLILLYSQGKLPTASLAEVDICHDDWCGVHRGKYCNRDPDIKVRLQRGDMSVGAGRAHAQGEGRSDQDSLNEDIHSLAAACRALPALWEQGVYDLAGAEG